MWYVYLVQGKDGSLYTGITTDLRRRVTQHNSGHGSKALRSKLPVKLVYSERRRSRSRALKREAAIKQWPRSEKLELVKSN